MDINVRQVVASDINYLTDIEIKCYEDAKGLDWWRETIKNPEKHAIIAVGHKVPIGFVVWSEAPKASDHTADVERLAVKPAFRKRGAGTMLLRDVITQARILDLTQLRLVVPESLCFPGHPDDVSEWLRVRQFSAVRIIKDHFEAYGYKEDAFVFVGSGLKPDEIVRRLI